MLLPVWIALLCLFVVTTAATFHLFLRARELWRTVRAAGPALDDALRELAWSLDRATRNADALGRHTPRLDASLDRLRRSLARAAVLRAAVQDVRDSVGRLPLAYGRKWLLARR